MSEQKRIKGSSVAAFLFMPQFHLSTRHMSHLVPVFMRILALMFVQAGLIPQNHPATMYGIQGVKKIGFSELMGEAWFTLRTTKATPYQWGLFASVVTMIGFMLTAAAVFMMHVVFGIGAVAQAQIFDHPNGATDMASLPGYTGFYDRSIPAATSAHGDYGIMMLDKVLRYGANGAVDGPLQDAMTGLMQIYNSGILIVAGIMLFWSVLSVVVDTAKTGTIGGGRHNMVWAPMRIVFALGLLIPLGTNGFSSGQYMVIKLAEWGSNFGTRAWITYVSTITNNASMVNVLHASNPTALVNQYVNMWLCRIAYNGYSAQTNTLNANTEIWEVDKIAADMGSKSRAFTNTTSSNLCGTIVYNTANDPMTNMSVSVGAPSATAIQTLKTNMTAAYETATNALEDPARNLACEFVAEFIYDTSGANPMLTATLPNKGGNLCASVGTQHDGNFGDQNQLTPMVAGFTATITPALTAARAALQAHITTADFIQELEGRGWAGMGMWYHRISQLNKTAADFQFPTVSITPGDWKTSGISSSHLELLEKITTKYEKWWLMSSDTVAAGAAAVKTGQTVSTAKSTSAVDSGIASAISSFGSDIKNAGPMGAWNAFTKIIGLGSTSGQSTFLFDIVEKEDLNVYPLAELAKTGTQIMTIGITLMGILSLIPIVLASANAIPGLKWITDLGPLADAVGDSVILQFFGTIAVTLVASGALLSYYVPIIPFLRTAFSVLTWITSVFEAVMMVPIAALAHLTTEGEGLAGGAKNAWILWLNVLLRPVLTVGGFVGALLIFNAFVTYFDQSFAKTLTTGNATGSFYGPIDTVLYTMVYVMTVYTAANTSFKLLDVIPNAMMRWMGGSADTSFDENNTAEYLAAGTHMIKGSGGAFAKGGKNILSAAARKRAPSITPST